jgi:3-isopropylmalate/(R)-2-methylmalate dehydratase small subunit
MVEFTIKGKAWCFGDNVNTDLIYPGKFLAITKSSEMGKYALAGLDEEFGKNVQAGDLIIAGSNFGSGSSREQAAMAIKYTGASAIVAVSYAHIFFRNIINQGVPAFQSQEAEKIVITGDEVELDFQNNLIKNITTGKTCEFQPLPDYLMEIIKAGGNIQYLKKKLNIE